VPTAQLKSLVPLALAHRAIKAQPSPQVGPNATDPHNYSRQDEHKSRIVLSDGTACESHASGRAVLTRGIARCTFLRRVMDGEHEPQFRVDPSQHEDRQQYALVFQDGFGNYRQY
jgi:hypothetical protein